MLSTEQKRRIYIYLQKKEIERQKLSKQKIKEQRLQKIRKIMKKIFLTIILSLFTLTATSFAQLRDSVLVDLDIFRVMYSETKEQPLWVEYTVRHIQKGADRKGMNFYKEKEYHTSDNDDYVRNVWDKGHMAPAAHFSDTEENLRQTFTYLNSALQHKNLNRVEWRLLEEKERDWAEVFGELDVRVDVIFDDVPQVLPTGAEIPDAFLKTIYFRSTKRTECYFFPNDVPDKNWNEYEVECK